ncbi:hypothetical protein ASE49_11085 [Novosphingobium sp. Leaf2]|nr:hypothetical protein ASE49_11085 [Novosphingobium sp. Leaf2]
MAVGFADAQGSLSVVASGVPLPVTTVRQSAPPAPLAGTTSANLLAGPFIPLADSPMHLQLSGTWSGSVVLERSVDGGATRQPLTAGGVAWARFTGNVNEPVWQEQEREASFYLAITLTSGTVSYRVSQ